MKFPPLKPLHPDTSLNPAKLAGMQKVATEILQASLVPGRKECLKTRRDGTILDGHHRVYVLRQRGLDIDSLAREIIEKDEEQRDDE